MNPTLRNSPRYLPTLTEVVHPSDVARTLVVQVPEPEALVQSVMHRIAPMIDRRLREESDALVRAVVAEQVQTLNAGLRQELELMVRQAVAEAMASRPDIHK